VPPRRPISGQRNAHEATWRRGNVGAHGGVAVSRRLASYVHVVVVATCGQSARLKHLADGGYLWRGGRLQTDAPSQMW